MEVVKEEKDNQMILHLKGELTIYAVSRFKDDLIEVFSKFSKVALELSEITELDTSGFQLLLSAKRTALSSGVTLELLGHNVKVLRVFAIYGAVGLFGDKIRLTNDEMSTLSFRYGLKKQNIEAGKQR